ncbi:MAG: outer rane efflux protein [Gemmatimonadetes bacterium]|nr:outer rane efflux protein [Gemmatimonadota bacterium]
MRLSLPVTLLVAVASMAQAQQRPAQGGATLTLDEALTLARRNNPTYLQQANARRSADAAVRSARAQLLPSADVSFSNRFQQGGKQVFNGLSFASSSDALQSSYNLGLNYRFNSTSLINPKLARANRDATEADITSTAEQLRSGVTQQYLVVLQAQARASVQDTLVATAKAQLDLANAKQSVGAGTILDVRRAEVAVGQAQVNALNTKNIAEVEKLRLFQQLGVTQPANVDLSTRFSVTEPHFSLDSLLNLARGTHPAVAALRSRERAAGLSVRSAQGAYTPTLSLSTGWGGNSYEYTNSNFLVEQARASATQSRSSCFSNDSLRRGAGLTGIAGCSQITFTDAQAAAIRETNNTYPFRFTRAPFSVSATLSLPLFDNLNREQRLEEAQVNRDNARFNTQARELQLTADVTQAFLQLRTNYQTAQLQEQNSAKAREELSYAEERYKVGAATFLDVITSRSTYEQALIDRVNAIYEYHKAFAALENAVGRPLR